MDQYSMTWREAITAALDKRGETWGDVDRIAPADLDLDRVFDPGYGLPEGSPFTVWSRTTIYFPACYDGAEGVAWVPRHPCNRATQHIGGG